MLVTGFTFFEAFILPLLASDSPKFAESFLGIFTGSVGETSVGALATLWSLLGVVYILGPVVRHRHVPRSASCRAGRRAAWPGRRVIPSVCAGSAGVRAARGGAGGIGSGVAGLCDLLRGCSDA